MCVCVCVCEANLASFFMGNSFVGLYVATMNLGLIRRWELGLRRNLRDLVFLSHFHSFSLSLYVYINNNNIFRPCLCSLYLTKMVED